MRLYQERQRDRFQVNDTALENLIKESVWATKCRLRSRDLQKSKFFNLSLPPSLTNRGSDWALVSRFLGSQRVLSFGPIPCSWGPLFSQFLSYLLLSLIWFGLNCDLRARICFVLLFTCLPTTDTSSVYVSFISPLFFLRYSFMSIKCYDMLTLYLPFHSLERCCCELKSSHTNRIHLCCENDSYFRTWFDVWVYIPVGLRTKWSGTGT